ncbi:Clavaminate synthase-like protein [Venturia nashicola]|uniref:Clavaminate synthase-like protein n=1 Tax=Venturia nashicola TaxID=86259 RepID=A0A4Z1PC78_9PEZI|nr:Clavaminate synthase-like protein [Venturia nashicola]TLD29401.1 Clavaminate synthase-like protein [Venturia nashicola]
MAEKESIQLPVLDISQPGPDTAKHLIEAVRNSGFVFIKNNQSEIAVADVDNMFALSKEFFQSPNDIKTPFSINSGASGKNSGWFSMHSEMLDPDKQKAWSPSPLAFNMNEFQNGKAQQPLPKPFAKNEAHVNAFIDQCRLLCIRILELLAIGLEINEKDGGKDWFTPHHDPARGPSGTVFRTLYYPSLPASPEYDSETDIRAGAHSDYGTITLLFQRPGQPGLEILASRRGDEEEDWLSVPINPTDEPNIPILVNVGDLLEYWTNGVLKSAVHRVVFPKDGIGEDRYSMAYFCHPIDEARLEAVPSKIVREAGGGGGKGVASLGGGKGVARLEGEQVLTARQHLEARLAATYL